MGSRIRQAGFIATGLLLATLAWWNVGVAADPAPANANTDPASACRASGGTYLGDLKCQLANGSIAPILAGADAERARLSAVPVAPNSSHTWALATTAITFEFNQHRHDLLSGVVATPEGVESGKRLLSKWWRVNNRGELLTQLSWLQFEGHRTQFDQLGNRIDALSDEEFHALEARVHDNAQAVYQLEVVRKDRALGEKGILAWDLVRYIAVCRWGYLAGYLSEAEAWDHIMPASLRLQQTFGSWQDMQSNFLIGREYWSEQQTQTNGGRFRDIYDRFLRDPTSPWNANPWTTDLKVATPLQIKAN